MNLSVYKSAVKAAYATQLWEALAEENASEHMQAVNEELNRWIENYLDGLTESISQFKKSGGTPQEYVAYAIDQQEQNEEIVRLLRKEGFTTYTELNELAGDDDKYYLTSLNAERYNDPDAFGE